MANIDFPPGAINGTTHTQNGKTWIFDGTSWSLVASLIPNASTTVSGLVNTSTQSFGGDKKFVNNLDIVGGLGVTGQSIFRNNIEIQSGGIGVSGGVTITGSGLTIISGGIGVTGQSVYRNNVEIQSGGLGVTGGIGVSGRIAIHAGGLGVTGSAVFNSSISAGSLSLSTPLPLSSGGTGLGSTSLANYILGMGNSSLGLEYKQIIEGSNITITHNPNSITIAAVGGSSGPGGPNNAIQYNGSGSFAGTSAFLWDNSSQRIDIKNTNVIGTGTTTGFLLQNSTASSVSVQLQFSPAIEFIGRAWKTSGSPATDTFVRYLEMVEVTSGAIPSGTITWKSSIHNASNQGPSYTKRAEISTNYGLGIYETTGVYKSSFINSASATTDIYYTLPSVVPAANQVLGVTGISASSVSLSWVTNGTVAIGTTGALAYYPGTGTSVDDAIALSYSTSGTHLVITSQTATDVPLRVDGDASSSVNLFQVRKGTTEQLAINSSGNVSISSSTGSTSSSTGALIVTGGVGIGQSLVTGGNIIVSRVIYAGTNTYSKSGFAAGDVLLDNGSADTPGILFYWGNNRNFGIDVFSAGTGTTKFRIVKELNESGGSELWSIDRNGVVTQTAWAPGEIIKMTVLVGSDLTGSNPTTVSSTSDTDVASYSYTPVSSSSYILIEFQTRYTVSGSTNDDFISRIVVDGSEQSYGQQYWLNFTGGGTRSGVLFPLMARYTNSNTTAKTISVTVRRGSSDDNATVYKDTTTVMKITEIGR